LKWLLATPWASARGETLAAFKTGAPRNLTGASFLQD
jgi:hypothetical protein